MAQTLPLDWVEEIKGELFAMGQAPILPPSPPFPLTSLSSQLEKTLGLKTEIQIDDPKILSLSEVKAHLPQETSRLFSVALLPHTNPLYVLIGYQDLNQIAADLLSGDIQAASSLQGSLQESFYLFLGAAVLDAISSVNHFTDFSFRLLSTHVNLPESSPSFLTLPVTIKIREKNLSLLLLISKPLQIELKKHSEKLEESFVRQSLVSPKINLVARLLLELVSLSLKEVEQLKTGSFLLLDKAHIDLSKQEADLQIVVGKRAFFAGHAVRDKVILTALAEPVEEIRKMENQPKPEVPKSAPLAAPTDQGKPVSAALPKAPLQNKDPEAKQTLTSPVTAEKIPPEVKPGPEEAKFFLGEDEEFFVEDEALSKVLKEKHTGVETSAVAKAPLEEVKADEAMTEKMSDVSLQVEVVVGYLRLSVKDLLEMQVGGSYTIGGPISSHVDLLINGKRIAKGELLRSGDLLGVRILSL